MSEQFSGHELESGLLQRVRSWRDAFPPLVMIDALRVAGAPIYVAMWLLVVMVGFGLVTPPSRSLQAPSPPWEVFEPWQYVTDGGLHREALLPINDQRKPAIESPSRPAQWLVMPCVLLFAVMLIGVSSLTIRAGALYAASRDAEPMADACRFVFSRSTTLLLVVALPWLCIGGLSIAIAAIGAIDRLPVVGNALSESLAIFAAPITILIGLIGAGVVIASPLGLAAASIEKRKDSFDALSRGYEYLYRRPVQLSLYLLLAGLLVGLVGWVTQCVAYTGAMLCSFIYLMSSGGEQLPWILSKIFASLTMAVTMTAATAEVGAIYLLLRKDANQQEIEDLAISPVDLRRAELPTLKKKPTAET